MRTNKRRSTRKGRTVTRILSVNTAGVSPQRVWCGEGTKGTLSSTLGVARTRTRGGLCLL